MKRRVLKSALALTAVVAMAAAVPDQADAQWKNNNQGWWWEENGSYTKDDFITVEGNTYYFADTGYMVFGWQNINGSWYYFNSSGAMAADWQNIGNSWYYFEQDGKMTSSAWKYLGGFWYYFNESGAMVTDGWVYSGDQWFYVDGSGHMIMNCWKEVKDNWYYFEANGAVAAQTWKQLGGFWYYFDGSGAMTTGWKPLGDFWYYLGDNGVMRTGWQYIGNRWYYFNESGVMKTGWQEINGKSYYMYSDGVMASEKWIGDYWVDASGVWTDTRMNYDGQIDVIVNNFKKWHKEREISCGYAIADLDQDGRLEVISSDIQGTGFFSHNEFWEVNDTKDGLVKCEDLTDMDQQMDIDGKSPIDAFYDPVKKQYYYMAEDFIRDGMAHYVTFKGSFTMKDNKITSDRLAVLDESEKGSVYKNMSGRTISRAQYDAVGDSTYYGLEKKSVTFGWVRELKSQDMYDKLNDSFLQFCIK